MKWQEWITPYVVGSVMILTPILAGGQQMPYTIIEELQKYAEQYKYEDFRHIQYFGVIDARLRTTGEMDGEKATQELGMSRAELIDYAKLRFKNNFTKIPFRQLPKDTVLAFMRNRAPERQEVGILILDIKIVAHKKIAALNVTLQAGSLSQINIWQNTDGDYYLREGADAQTKLKKLIDALMVQLAIDFFKVHLGIQ